MPGTQIANKLQVPSQNTANAAQKLRSLQELIDALGQKGYPSISMLRSTASWFSKFVGKPSAEIPLEILDSDRHEFREYLRMRKIAPNSVRTYSHFANRLLRAAKTMGWHSSPAKLPPSWIPLEAEIKRRKIKSIVKYLIVQNRTPATVLETDIAQWVGLRVRQGRSLRIAVVNSQSLRRLLCAFSPGQHVLSRRIAKTHYGIPVECFPEPLRSDVEEAISFKQKRYAKSRTTNVQIRDVTAKQLRMSFSALYGWAVNVAHMNGITTIRELITEDNAAGFIEWALNERKITSKSITLKLALIAGALRQNPRFRNLVDSWLPTVIKALPLDSDEDTLRRKEERYLPYEVLAQIPILMLANRPCFPRATPFKTALAVRNELLMKWPTILPWRQRNIREMRIAGERPNLFKAPFPKFSSIAKPEWVQRAEQKNPNLEVWQISFSKNETKTRIDVAAVLPQALVSLLEEYISFHRQQLVGEVDPGTLFLNERGNPLTSKDVATLISHFTLKYGGRVVTPHLYRDIFAYMWLDRRPEDYLTLSKLLWHRDINTTIRIYGQRFNESAALRRMEEVL
jgi:hypothetical protein